MKQAAYLTASLIIALSGFSIFHSCGDDTSTADASGSAFVEAAHAREAPQDWQNGSADIDKSRQNALTRAIASVSPTVVGINVTQVKNYVTRNPYMEDPFWRQFFGDRYRGRSFSKQVESLGSGFVISEDGYIVTNQHVVENAVEIVVAMTDGRHYNARKVGEDHDTDIALLKIDAKGLPFARLGHSDDLIVGEWAIAIGNPFGLFDLNDKPTVTIGVISAIDRDWGRTNNRVYEDMIQTDAAINRGNSGGPLVNSLGEVIGMNAFIYTGSQTEHGFVGIGFAIPVDKISEVIAELREHGKVNREYRLGILSAQDLNPYIVRALGLQVNTGVIVSRLEEGGPAEKAGLQEMDIIVAVEKKAIANQRQLIQELRNRDLKVGTVVAFKVIRDNRQREIKIKLEAR